MLPNAFRPSFAHGTSYRPDIDGLRAVAVLSVVLFHAGVAWFPGGFVGVDIFFVISGYLITGIVWREIKEGRFTFSGFYLRRARRILPALFVVLAVTMALGVALLTPGDLRSLAKVAAATFLFTSNIVLWTETGYFGGAAELKPLLHTWSLAIEEQFYLLWPVVLLYVSRAKAPAVGVATGLLALSLALSCYGILNHPSATFYLLPTRTWELMIGAALALGSPLSSANSSLRHIGSLAGAILLTASIAFIDRNTPFPGWSALFPCAGAALLIAAGERAIVNRLLSLKPLVFVGLISYSLYLWHWPLLSLCRILLDEDRRIQAIPYVLALSFFLSAVTWRYVEIPFRRKAALGATGEALSRFAGASLACCLLAVAVFASNGLPWRVPPAVLVAETASRNVNPMQQCVQSGDRLSGDECWLNRAGTKRAVVIWGDSHAFAFAPAVLKFAQENGYSLYELFVWSCPPLLGIESVFGLTSATRHPVGNCRGFNEKVIQFLRDNSEVAVVVLAANWSLYTQTAGFGQKGNESSVVAYLVDGDNTELSEANSRRAFREALKRTVLELRKAGKQVILVGQVPEVGIDVPRCLALSQMPLGHLRNCEVEESVVRNRQQHATSVLMSEIQPQDGVCVLHPVDTLCSSGKCLTSAAGRILYVDSAHLSVDGAHYVGDRLAFANCVKVGRQAQPGPRGS